MPLALRAPNVATGMILGVENVSAGAVGAGRKEPMGRLEHELVNDVR